MFNFARNFLKFLRGHPDDVRVAALSIAQLPPPSYLKPAPKGKIWCLQLDGKWKLVKSFHPVEYALETYRWPSIHRQAALKRMRGKKPTAHGKRSRKPKSSKPKSRSQKSKRRRA